MCVGELLWVWRFGQVTNNPDILAAIATLERDKERAIFHNVNYANVRNAHSIRVSRVSSEADATGDDGQSVCLSEVCLSSAR